MWNKIREHVSAHARHYVAILFITCVITYLAYTVATSQNEIFQLQSPPSSIYPQYIKCTMIYEPSTNPTWSITSSITVEVKNEKDMQSFRRQAYNNQFIHILRPPTTKR